MYIAYSNGIGGTTLSQRSSWIHWQPFINRLQGFQVAEHAPDGVLPLSGQTFGVSFIRTMIDTTGSRAQPISFTGPTQFVFAYNKDSPPKEPMSPSSSFKMHTNTGSFTLDLSSPAMAKDTHPIS
jgi:hypothetical protein